MQSQPGTNQVLVVPWGRIRPNPDQPRQYFDPNDLQQLATSIRQDGQRELIRVRVVEGDPRHDYQIVNGERRWRACGIAKVSWVMIWVVEVKDEEDEFEQSLLANNPPKSLTPMETARGIQRLRNGKRLAHLPPGDRIARIAVQFERTPVWVYQQLSLLKLHPEVQRLIEPSAPEDQRLNVTIGIALSSISAHRHPEAAREIVEKRMTVNQARAYIQTLADQEGARVGIGKRGRKPVDDFRKFQTFVWGMRQNAELFVKLSRQRFRDVFGRRSVAERSEMVRQLREAERDIRELRQALEKVG